MHSGSLQALLREFQTSLEDRHSLLPVPRYVAAHASGHIRNDEFSLPAPTPSSLQRFLDLSLHVLMQEISLDEVDTRQRLHGEEVDGDDRFRLIGSTGGGGATGLGLEKDLRPGAGGGTEVDNGTSGGADELVCSENVE